MLFFYKNKFTLLLIGATLVIGGVRDPALVIAGIACFAFYFYLIYQFPPTSESKAFIQIVRECTSSKLSGFDREKNIKKYSQTLCALQGIVYERVNANLFWLYVPNIGGTFHCALKEEIDIPPFTKGNHVEIEFYPSFRTGLAAMSGLSSHEVSNFYVTRITCIR